MRCKWCQEPISFDPEDKEWYHDDSGITSCFPKNELLAAIVAEPNN